MQKFNQIPENMRFKILSNVFCSNCKDMVKIVDFTATMNKSDLVLKGRCANCASDVARLIEE